MIIFKYIQMFLIILLLSQYGCDTTHTASIYAPDHQYTHYPKYQFSYGVKDHKTGDIKQQWESRDGDKVKGHYALREPDGTIRSVDYTADDKNGFHAVVTHNGHAHHPSPDKAISYIGVESKNLAASKHPEIHTQQLHNPDFHIQQSEYIHPKQIDVTIIHNDEAKKHEAIEPEPPKLFKPSDVKYEHIDLSLLKNIPQTIDLGQYHTYNTEIDLTPKLNQQSSIPYEIVEPHILDTNSQFNHPEKVETGFRPIHTGKYADVLNSYDILKNFNTGEFYHPTQAPPKKIKPVYTTPGLATYASNTNLLKQHSYHPVQSTIPTANPPPLKYVYLNGKQFDFNGYLQSQKNVKGPILFPSKRHDNSKSAKNNESKKRSINVYEHIINSQTHRPIGGVRYAKHVLYTDDD